MKKSDELLIYRIQFLLNSLFNEYYKINNKKIPSKIFELNLIDDNFYHFYRLSIIIPFPMDTIFFDDLIKKVKLESSMNLSICFEF